MCVFIDTMACIFSLSLSLCVSLPTFSLLLSLHTCKMFLPLSHLDSITASLFCICVVFSKIRASRRRGIRYRVRTSHKDARRERELASGEVGWNPSAASRQLRLCPVDAAHSFPNARWEMNRQREGDLYNQVQSLLQSTFWRFVDSIFFFSHLPSPTLFSFVLTCLPSIDSYTVFPPLMFWFFPATIPPCQHCQSGPCGAEKIEPQIEQSISVRIHQCQTTPSLAVCIQHAHMHSYSRLKRSRWIDTV